MTKQILVGLESSPSGRAAVASAIQLARRTGATLVGLAIVDEPEIRSGAATGIGGAYWKSARDATLVEDAELQVRAWLHEFRTACDAAGVAARTYEEHGRAGASLLGHMADCDLVVLGRDANFHFETAVADPDTRDRVLRDGRKPVLVVPEAPPTACEGVMVAYDGSSAAKRAVTSFADSGLASDVPIHVVAIDDDGASAYETASRGVELLAARGLAARPLNVVSVLPMAEALLHTRNELRADLIVMGAYTRPRLATLLWGSVTRHLLSETPVPLFLHH
jgi:nucleotide-binding universal stress UspA family protein